MDRDPNSLLSLLDNWTTPSHSPPGADPPGEGMRANESQSASFSSEVGGHIRTARELASEAVRREVGDSSKHRKGGALKIKPGSGVAKTRTSDKDQAQGPLLHPTPLSHLISAHPPGMKDPWTEMLMMSHQYSFRSVTVLPWHRATSIGMENSPDPFGFYVL